MNFLTPPGTRAVLAETYCCEPSPLKLAPSRMEETTRNAMIDQLSKLNGVESEKGLRKKHDNKLCHDLQSKDTLEGDEDKKDSSRGTSSCKDQPYIITSKSFQEASRKLSGSVVQHSAGGRYLRHVRPHHRPLHRIMSGFIDTRENLQRLSLGSHHSATLSSTRPLLHRSAFIHQKILQRGMAFTDYYDLNVEHLGEGSFGSVFAARNKRTNSLRAVKIVDKSRIDNLTRLKREILIMKTLDHPSIIRLFEVFENEKNLYLVMEICLGGELFDRVIKFGHFSEHYSAIIIKQIFSAILYCHSQDIMHRDLKPENVLYSDVSSSVVKVIDWGFSAKRSKSKVSSSLVGTPYYVAPEVLQGHYDHKCDLWSAGVILFILLCGYPPFHGKDNKTILEKVKEARVSFDSHYWSKISSDAKNLINGLLCYDSRQRLTAAQALSHPWLRFHTEMPIQENVSLTSKFGGHLISKFRSFQKQKKLKKLALTALAFQIDKRNSGKLYDVFSCLDRNGDGVLSMTSMHLTSRADENSWMMALQEFSIGLSHVDAKFSKEVDELFSELDTDGSRTIDYTEFLAASLDDRFCEQENLCKRAFLMFDLDGDGQITMNEIQTVIKMNFDQEESLTRFVQNIIQEADMNKDGSIDFQEFMQMMKANRNKIRKKCLSNFIFFSKSDTHVP